MCCDSGSAPAPQDNKFMDVLADISQKQWERNVKAFQPLEDRAIQAVERFQTPQFAAEQEGKASADVAQSFAAVRDQQAAQDASLGVNPADGRYGFVNRGLTIAQAGADATAVTNARRQAEGMAFDALAGMSGRGDAKVGQAINAASAGGNQYAQLQRNQIDYEGQQNQGLAGLGQMAGMAMMFSSKQFKEGKKPYAEGLSAIRKMPVAKYHYKPEMAAVGEDPTQERVGPMAEDFQKATGVGDGKMIHLPSALGITMAAVRELDKKVSKLQGARA